MTTPDPRGDARRPGSFDEIRGYLAAAGDLSSIARARILEAARAAARTEIERAGGALGLAGAEEVSRMRRTIERLERRVGVLEAPGGPGARPGSRPASRGTGRREPTPRPASLADPQPSAPAATEPAGASGGPAAAPAAPQASAPATGTAPVPPTRSASGSRPPVRRPSPQAPADGDAGTGGPSDADE